MSYTLCDDISIFVDDEQGETVASLERGDAQINSAGIFEINHSGWKPTLASFCLGALGERMRF
jgi:hypothetical protein